jgi:formylglycine-generating enzyme
LLMTNRIGMQLVLIPAGDFMMGSPDSDIDAVDHEKPQHLVRITKPYFLQSTEVTRDQWERVMETSPWEGEKDIVEGIGQPATCVSWDEATEFCRRLSSLDGYEYRLPTEAEWEYACRAGSTTKYSSGNDTATLHEYAWFLDRALGIQPSFANAVGTKRANAWRLHDMHGNVMEYCADVYGADYYRAGAEPDPTGPSPASDSLRVVRGGYWLYEAQLARSGSRLGIDPDSLNAAIGFRVALTAPPNLSERASDN